MNKRVDILWRVWLVGICLAMFGMGIFIRAGMTQWHHGEELIAELDSLVVTAEVLPAQRRHLYRRRSNFIDHSEDILLAYGLQTGRF